jgi:hypothetical protein
LKDVFRGLFLVPFYGTKLRESRLVRMLISSRGSEIAGKDSSSTARVAQTMNGDDEKFSYMHKPN